MMQNQFEQEQRFVIEAFEQSFAVLKQQDIVLYGVGKNTEAVLYGTNGFSFAGLMDQSTTGQMIYGHKVLSDAEVIDLHPIIVIIARESVVNIIFKRIQYLATEYGISIYDYKGKLLGQDNESYTNEELPYWDASALELMNAICEHDIISFDIFDTLIMRRVLLPDDVFFLVEGQLREEGWDYPFAKVRKEAENVLTGCPNIDEIYNKMQQITGWGDALLEHMKAVEYETDASLLIRREQICDIFDWTVKQGKEVYIISDMYYSEEYLSKLLESLGIRGYRKLFVSCDRKAAKSDGSLFRVYASQVGSGSKLHIGDNRRADIQKAEENGIDAYQIYSSYELLMASALQEILTDVKTLRQRCVLGTVIAKIFNDPFKLYACKGYLYISDIREIGYCFVAPMLTEFVAWFSNIIKEKNIQQVLFPSRDGFLLKKAFEMVSDGSVEPIYFRTSRRAAAVASIRTYDDIERIACRRYNGVYEDFLKARFGIEMRSSDERRNLPIKDVGDELTKHVLKDYKSAIIQRAEKERANYSKYLEEKGVLSGKSQVLFDFVAGGSVQYNLERMLQRNLMGIYFATMNLPNNMYSEDTERIITAYGNIRSYGTQNNLGKYYLFLETVLIEDKETFSYIDENGQEIFEEGTLGEHIDEIMRLQDSILDYVQDFRETFPMLSETVPELDFADKFFGSIFSKQCVVETSIKQIFQNDDVYDGVEAFRIWND